VTLQFKTNEKTIGLGLLVRQLPTDIRHKFEASVNINVHQVNAFTNKLQLLNGLQSIGRL